MSQIKAKRQVYVLAKYWTKEWAEEKFGIHWEQGYIPGTVQEVDEEQEKFKVKFVDGDIFSILNVWCHLNTSFSPENFSM
eukprot:m.235295 g.235295  ORF g.235295 m.235295 type:complete len:80 (+) comp26531_c1_seq8:1199-1438(+)